MNRNWMQDLNWKWWTACGLLVAAALFSCGYYLVARSSAEKDPSGRSGALTSKGSPASVEVKVDYPHKGGLERTTTQPGSVQAFESVKLIAEVSGYLKIQTVDIGDHVKRGQLLAKIAVPDLDKQVVRDEAELEQSQAKLALAQARLITAKAEVEAAKAAVVQSKANDRSKAAALRFRDKQLQRIKELVELKSVDARLLDEEMDHQESAFEAKAASAAAITTTEAQATAANAKVQQAEADITEAQAEIKVSKAELDKAIVLVGFATIKAPFDGVITQRSLFPNDFVRSAKESGGQVPLLTVQRTDLFRVVIQVPDSDAPYVDAGAPADLEISTLPDVTFPKYKVSRIATSEDEQTRTMRTEVDVPNPNGVLRDGMYGRVTIHMQALTKNVFTVPTGALVHEENKVVVYVVNKDNKIVITPVRVSFENGNLAEITTGLKADDRVVVDHKAPLFAGTSVTIVEQKEQK